MNTVTQDQIDSLIDNAETQEALFWDKELVVSYRLESGFTICGRAACVDPANFNLEIGREIAKQDAICQLWQLEGYRLQLTLAGLIVEGGCREGIKSSQNSPASG